MNADPSPPWWKGERGEWFVLGQFVLVLLVLVGPRALGALGAWSLPFVRERQVLGAVLILAGRRCFFPLPFGSVPR